MKKTFPLFLVILAFGCNSKTGTSSNTVIDSTDAVTNAPNTKSQDENAPGLLDGCYMKVTGRDTLFLQLNESGGIINGTMQFDNYEKDSSHGNVTGKMEDGKLVLWYSFNAEGMHSYSQQILQPVKDGLVLGNSDVRVSNDTAYIKDLSAVEFPASNTLTRTQCSGL